jgi:hypothetical protein
MRTPVPIPTAKQIKPKIMSPTPTEGDSVSFLVVIFFSSDIVVVLEYLGGFNAEYSHFYILNDLFL